MGKSNQIIIYFMDSQANRFWYSNRKICEKTERLNTKAKNFCFLWTEAKHRTEKQIKIFCLNNKKMLLNVINSKNWTKEQKVQKFLKISTKMISKLKVIKTNYKISKKLVVCPHKCQYFPNDFSELYLK